MDLVENEDLDANVAKRVDGFPLHIDDAGARVMRCVNGGVDLREEPLARWDVRLGSTTSTLLGFGVESVVQPAAAVRFELVHQHGLPHPAVAVDDQGRAFAWCADA